MKLDSWIADHYADYLTALSRVDRTRTFFMTSGLSESASVLKNAYVFAVLSIKTPLDRHEKAYTQWATGSEEVGEAAARTVYGNQKAGWIRETLAGTDWKELAMALRTHVNNGRYEEALEITVDDLKGASYRKGAFVLAMSGVYEFMCVDSNVAQFADYDESEGNALEYSSAAEYLATCDEVLDMVPSDHDLPPFMLQWAVYDYQRKEHAGHRCFYRQVLPDVLLRP